MVKSRNPLRFARAQSGLLEQPNSFVPRSYCILKVCAVLSFHSPKFIFELLLKKLKVLFLRFVSQICITGNDAEEESDEDEDYVPSEDWKKVCRNFIPQTPGLTQLDCFVQPDGY